jgi:hypothetical protein
MLLALLAALASGGILPSLPTDDPAMPWLLRWDGRPGCRLPAYRPYPGEAVLACLEGLDTATLPEGDRIRRRQILARLDLRRDGDYRRPLWRSGEADRDVVALDLGASGYLNYAGKRLPVTRKVVDADTTWDTLPHDLVLGGVLHPRVDVLLGPEVALWARLRQLTEVSDGSRWLKEFDADDGVYQTALFAKSTADASYGRTSDWLEGGFEVDFPWLRGEAGVQRLRWGAMPVNPLMFSGNAEPMQWASLRKTVGPVESEVLYGSPIGVSYEEDRKLYAHRTRVALSPWLPLELGFSEAMISNGHSFQPLYVMPVFPLFFTGHYLGTPDNLLMDFDAALRPAASVELSGELFLDDLQNALGFFSDGWGNKWGLALGARLSGWTGLGSLDLLQATRIEPWVYTTSATDLPGSGYTTPVHFGTLLGHPSGPNSLTLDWIHRQDLSEAWSWTARAQGLWKGTDTGSSWRDVNARMVNGKMEFEHETKSWLSGSLMKRVTLGGGFEWRFLADWRMAGEIAGTWQDSLGHRDLYPEVSLRLSWRE